MSELFEIGTTTNKHSFDAPLADRIRPTNPEEVVGQKHLLGENAPLRKFFENKNFQSIILWGPPGVGKTTIALLIAEVCSYEFIKISAVEAGVKDLRNIISNASRLKRAGKRTLLFIDEIHRFNKSQQDALLHSVESGLLILVGATTENPSFEVNSALLSRCRVYRLELLHDSEIKILVERALEKDIILSKKKIHIQDWEFLYRIAAGDARAALNAIELAINLNNEADEINITTELLTQALQQKTPYYDKKGETHYDTISAFIKSMRGSDPDAALFWLAKMLDSGEDPKFIARRMVIFASEDIGNAEPFALTLAVSVFHAVELIGLPECRINLAHGVTYLASCPKSNASYLGIEKALADVKSGISLSVPLHLRNAPTKLMKDEGYGKDYKYPHDFEGHFTFQQYFPDDVKRQNYYFPTDEGRETKIKERLKKLWGS